MTIICELLTQNFLTMFSFCSDALVYVLLLLLLLVVVILVVILVLVLVLVVLKNSSYLRV